MVGNTDLSSGRAFFEGFALSSKSGFLYMITNSC